jgi:hypothetical protein
MLSLPTSDMPALPKKKKCWQYWWLFILMAVLSMCNLKININFRYVIKCVLIWLIIKHLKSKKLIFLFVCSYSISLLFPINVREHTNTYVLFPVYIATEIDFQRNINSFNKSCINCVNIEVLMKNYLYFFPRNNLLLMDIKWKVQESIKSLLYFSHRHLSLVDFLSKRNCEAKVNVSC